MPRNSYLRLAIPLAALTVLFAVVVACADSDEPDPENTPAPSATPFYSATNAIPTTVPGQPEVEIENLPVPTPQSLPTVTASGLEIYEVSSGTGAPAASGDIVYVNYTNWVKGGNQVDKNHLGPVRYQLVEDKLIPGLIEGITGMMVGGKRILVMPPALAYGAGGSGNVIPPNATLIYEIEVTEIR